MEEQSITLADIKALGDKLDSVDLTPAEKSLLAAAMDVTAKVISEGGEVEGFGFSTSFNRLQAPVVNAGMGRMFENSFSSVINRPNPNRSAFDISIGTVSSGP